MSVRRWILPITVLLLAACNDTTTPVSAPDQAGPHFLRWAPTAAPRFEAIGAVTQGPVLLTGGPSFDLTSPALATYQASFWAVRGWERQLVINYLSDDGESHRFLRFRAEDPIWAPGRGNLAMGDSVLITVNLDSLVFAAHFEPSGLQFGNPAQLRFYYDGVDGDLNGDGHVDKYDEYITQQLLGMWYQASPTSSWVPMAAEHDREDKRITTDIEHFSGYAISW